MARRVNENGEPIVDTALLITPRGNGKSRTTLWQSLSQHGFSDEEILEMFANIEMPERRTSDDEN